MVRMQTVPRLYNTFQPSHYTLALALEREARRFFGTVTIIGNKVSNDQPITLHVKDLTIKTVSVGSKTSVTTTHAEFDQLVIDYELPAGEHSVTIEFEGTITDGMHGLYPCYYDVNGEKKELLATQFESHHAREVFPCIDEPEAKATFNLELTTESGVTVLSNMPVKTQEVAETTHTVFETTPQMSTYLLAFVVGDMQKKTASTKSGVEVNVWATKAQSADSLDFPLEVATKSIDFFDEYFGTPYPLPKADHVALPDFTSGAMENWGLITYREITLLVNKNSSVSMREYVATVITHETSHQWFGNLVTMKWWDDLWLNESFATIMEYVAVDALYPSWQAWNTFASQESLSALRRDQLAGVQAVKCEVNHPDEISTLFDPSIVYAKGGRLLKMLKAYIGEDAFRAGLQAYFKKHAYGNTVGADLWRAFSEASGKDIEGFMDTWISQSGFPLVSVTTTDTGYALSQERFVIGEPSGKNLWPIPLFAHNTAFPELLSDTKTSFDAPAVLPLLNRGNEAHFVTQYDNAAWKLILSALSDNKLAIIDRLALLHETSLLARGGRVPAASLIPLLGSYKSEDAEPVWNIISMVIGDLKRFVEDDEPSELHLKALVTRVALPLYEKLGFDQLDSESEQDTKLRATIVGLLSYAEYQDVIDRGLRAFRSAENLGTLPSEIRGIVLSIAAKHGSGEDFERLLTTHRTTTNAELRDDATSGLCAARDVEQIKQLLLRMTDNSLVKQQDVFRWFIYLLRNRFAREQAWQWMTDNWKWIEKTFKGDKSYDDFPRYSASVLATRSWLDKYVSFFDPMQSETTLKRAIEIGRTEIESRVEWLERDTEAVRATLAQETE
jgi:aminopeptidase N